LKLSIISKMSQREKTYKAIKQAIISYEVKPGEPLAEEQIANKLGVSRTPVREALKELRKEGLVKMIHRKGAFVAEISNFNSISKNIEMKNYKDIFDTDIKLHSLIVNTAGNRRLSKFLNILNGQVHRMRVLSATVPGRLNESLQEHKDILDALKKRDINLAEQRLKQHIRNIKNNILERL